MNKRTTRIWRVLIGTTKLRPNGKGAASTRSLRKYKLKKSSVARCNPKSAPRNGKGGWSLFPHSQFHIDRHTLAKTAWVVLAISCDILWLREIVDVGLDWCARLAWQQCPECVEWLMDEMKQNKWMRQTRTSDLCLQKKTCTASEIAPPF